MNRRITSVAHPPVASICAASPATRCSYSLVLEGRSPHIDETARAAVRHYVDLTRLLLAALPARAEDLNLKLAALTPPNPLVPQHGNLRAMLEAGARADIQRLRLPNPPHWVLEWAIT